MWLLTTSTVSAICIEAVPVQESLWKLTPTPLPLASTTTITTTKSKGLAMSVIIPLLHLMLLWLFPIPLPEKVNLHPIFLGLLPLSHTLNLPSVLLTSVSKLRVLTPWLLFLQIRNPGEFQVWICYAFVSVCVLIFLLPCHVFPSRIFCFVSQSKKISYMKIIFQGLTHILF